MQKVVIDLVWCRIGVRKFEAKVNKLLEDGWMLKECKVVRQGFRYLCMAVVDK